MGKLIPVTRIGWQDAKKLIQSGEYDLLELADGHAELLGRGPKGLAHSPQFRQKSFAYYYLTKASVKLLKSE